MAMESQILKERRKSSRVVELQGCYFTYRDSTHHAVILHLSLNGALIASKLPVPMGNEIEVTVHPAFLEKEITLKAEVIRSTIDATDQSLKYRLVIHFRQPSVDLLGLISKLNAEYM